MSDAKTQSKAANSSKKSEASKPAAGNQGAGTSTSTSEFNSGGGAASAPKSASERSISHFSSVSTPAYKAGWDSIFGGSKTSQIGMSNSANDDHFPAQLTIDDEAINEELRAALYKAFQKQAHKQGVSLAKIKKRADLSYTLKCAIEEK